MEFKDFLFAVFNTWTERMGIILTIIPFIEKIPRLRTWLQDKPLIERFLPWLWKAGVVLLIWGFYAAWLEQRHSVLDAQEKLAEMTKPQLAATLNQFISGDTSDGCEFLMDLSIRNFGAPSIAYGWHLKLKSDSLDLDLMPTTMVEGFTMVDAGRPVARFHGSFRLEERAMKPIERGQLMGGWLRFVIRGVKQAQLRDAQGTLFFNDVYDHAFTAEFNKLPEIRNPQVYPGSGDSPFMP
jgi:hypothetical protein